MITLQNIWVNEKEKILNFRVDIISTENKVVCCSNVPEKCRHMFKYQGRTQLLHAILMVNKIWNKWNEFYKLTLEISSIPA